MSKKTYSDRVRDYPITTRVYYIVRSPRPGDYDVNRVREFLDIFDEPRVIETVFVRGSFYEAHRVALALNLLERQENEPEHDYCSEDD